MRSFSAVPPYSWQHRSCSKVPRRVGGTTRIKREIGDLRKQLQQFIHLEEYEKAAAIRDKIRVLEDALQKKEEGGTAHEE